MYSYHNSQLRSKYNCIGISVSDPVIFFTDPNADLDPTQNSQADPDHGSWKEGGNHKSSYLIFFQ